MEHSEKITNLATALLNVQSEIDHVSKNSQNPHFGNTYADLNAFLHAVREPLRAAGITMIQSPGMSEGWVTVETLLVHQSGEWIRGTAGSPMQKDDPQGVGSAITYLRRYSLASLLAIPQEDDDGNAASTPRSTSRSAPQQSSGEGFHCPECGGPMWDNRDDPKASRNGGKRPDFKCKDKGCDHPIWGDHPDEVSPDKIRALMDLATIQGKLDEKQATRCEEAIESEDPDLLWRTLDWLRGRVRDEDEEEEPEPETVGAGADDQSDIPF